MKPRVLEWLVCPLCRQDLALQGAGHDPQVEVEAGILECKGGHRFPLRRGVPRLTPDSELSAASTSDRSRDKPAVSIGDSFSAEWMHYDYERSRTWHATVESRRELFLREVRVDPEALRGQLVLDAGCGNGSLSNGISEYGCEVLAVDVSDSVEAAQRYYSRHGSKRTHYVQADLMNLPVRHGCADVVYSSGVLHHNPDTRLALHSVARALRPRGRIYIWVYHLEPGLKFWLQLRLRSALAALPGPLKRGFVYTWSVQSMLRQYLRTLLGRNDAADRLTWRERIVDLMDIYTPRYRWMHTQAEVQGWYAELGLVGVETTEVRDWGFGVLGIDRGPAEQGAGSALVPRATNDLRGVRR